MNNFTFLTYEQIFTNQLDIIKKYGTKAASTDFAILLGAYTFGLKEHYVEDDNSLKGRSYPWWTKTNFDRWVFFINDNGHGNDTDARNRMTGARPALPYSSISSNSKNKVRVSQGILEVEYGEYPQTIVDKNYSKKLENAYNSGNIIKAGKSYTTDSVFYDKYKESFHARKHIVYEYQGSKYIRFVGDDNGKGNKLSDGRIIKTGNIYWVKVEPITWLVDEDANIAVSKKILFSGVQFDNMKDYDGDFDRANIKKFMNIYFSKEIVPLPELTKDISSNNISEEDIVIRILRDSSERKKQLFEELRKSLISQSHEYGNDTNCDGYVKTK